MYNDNDYNDDKLLTENRIRKKIILDRTLIKNTAKLFVQLLKMFLFFDQKIATFNVIQIFNIYLSST